jgi:hypothetical protein
MTSEELAAAGIPSAMEEAQETKKLITQFLLLL